MISYLQVGLAFGLLLICALLSWRQGQKLEKDLLVSGARVVVQLLVLGLVLGWLFSHSSIVFSLTAVLVMTVNSALHSSSRVKSKYAGLFLDNFLSTALGLWPVALIGTQLLSNETWWKVETLLPLVGMMLGNTLNGLSMAIDHFTHDVREKKDEVLSWLAIGATVQEATRDLFRKSLRLALTPTINSMLSMGIVSIPGMMTGQLISGVSPVQAAIVQIIMMFLVASGTYFGTSLGLILSRRRLFDKEGRPCYA